MITILMSVYISEKPDHLHQALESLITQLSGNDEIILVEDGPVTIELSNTIDYFKNMMPIKSVIVKKNVGLAKALNIGLMHATQPWVIRFDSDDICDINRIKNQKRVIKANIYDFFGGQIVEFDELNSHILGIRRVPLCSSDIIFMLPKRNPFNHVTMCIRRKLLQENPYPNIPGFEDYALWATLISKGYKFGNIDKILVKVRAGSNMLGRRSGLNYIKLEMKLRRHIISLRFYKTNRIIWYGILRCLSFLLPLRVKSIIYRKYLRN